MKNVYIDMIFVLLGNLILAFAVRVFILPYSILSGGVAGIGVSLQKLTGINADTWITILIVGLFIVGAIFLDKKFAVHTFASSILYPLFLNVFSSIDMKVTIDPMLASFYGGLIAGIGVGLVFRRGASTGGMDVPPLVIHKFTNISIAKLVLVVDLFTVGLGMFVFGPEAVLIGFISVFASAFAIDKVITFGAEEAHSVMIISDHVDEISKMIHDKLDRGTTLLDARGGYTKDEKPVILAVISKHQYPELVIELKRIDKHAFVIVTDALEVKGNGFSFDYKI